MLRRCALFLVLSALASAPGAAAEPPTVELMLSEEALTAVLAAACPIKETVDTGMAGLGAAAKLNVELFEPSVRVTNAAVKVTVRYRASDAGGLLNLSGVAKPDLKFTVNRAKGIIEGRLTRLTVSLPGGAEIPVDAALEPFTLPAVWPAPVEIYGKPMIAEVTVTEVVPETGHAILRGQIAFKPRLTK